jgi:hypothetical protein
LQFDWIAAAPGWSVVTDLAPVPMVRRLIPVPASFKSHAFRVRIVPSPGWESLALRVAALNPIGSGEAWVAPVGGTFHVSGLRAGDVSQPTRLRTGVLRALLEDLGARSRFVFAGNSPYLPPW